MKQTAVEWLYNKINNDFENNDFLISYANEIEQAKEMEKQQIKTSFRDGFLNNDKNSEQYYNEQFKNK
jgi:hypothetical protein